MIASAVTRSPTSCVRRGVLAVRRTGDSYPAAGKLLLTLKPYAFGEDVITDDLAGNTGEDVVISWRGRTGEDVLDAAYMIPEEYQASMFALLGEGLWFDSQGIAKQVNTIELATSDEINSTITGVWYRTDAAAGVGKREVLFYDTALLTTDDLIAIASRFKTTIEITEAFTKYTGSSHYTDLGHYE